MSYTARMTELRYIDSNFGQRGSNKYYRVYVLEGQDEHDGDNRVVFQWGRWGSKGQTKVERTEFPETAAQLAAEKLEAKTKKGYDVSRSMQRFDVVPPDILELAAVDANVRSQAEKRLEVDSFARFAADSDKLIRLLTGPTELSAEAVVLHSTLSEQLDALRRSLTDAEGRMELIEDVRAMKANA